MKKFMKCMLIGLTLMGSSLGAQDFKLKLWEKDMPNTKITGENEIWDTNGVVRVKNVQEPGIAVYLPPERVANGQAVIVCPGGGYGVISYQWEGVEIAKWLNSKGIAAIVLKYRLPYQANNVIRYESPLLDAQRSVRMVRYYAEKWNIHPQKIGFMGFSAGGHLASTLITNFDSGISDANNDIDKQSCRPDFAILMYPVITMYEPFVHMGSRRNLLGDSPSDELLKQFSNHLQVKENTPPTFLVHASNDGAVPVDNSLLFYKALVENGVAAEMHIFPYGGHGFSMGLGLESLNNWTGLCIDWLNYINTK